jgi:hypothetical protein
MKRIAAIVSILLWSHSYGQLAGVVGSFYVDINPDTAIDCYAGGPGSFNENFLLDIDGDSQADFKIQGTSGTGGMVSAYSSIDLQTLNASSYILKSRIDSVYNTYLVSWHVYNVAKPLAYGDSIVYAGSEWNNSYCEIYNNTYVTGSHIYIHDFPDSVDSYIGIGKLDGNTAYGGWIRITMTKAYPNKTCTVKDYSLYPINSSSGNPFALSENKSGSLLMFPNPAANTFYIKDAAASLSEVEVFDINGKRTVLPVLGVDAYTSKVDLSTLGESVYIVSFNTANGPVRQKLVIKR